MYLAVGGFPFNHLFFFPRLLLELFYAKFKNYVNSCHSQSPLLMYSMEGSGSNLLIMPLDGARVLFLQFSIAHKTQNKAKEQTINTVIVAMICRSNSFTLK